MPRITDNDDGTKTFAIDSSEFTVFKDIFRNGVADVEKLLNVVDAPQFRSAVDFVKSAFDASEHGDGATNGEKRNGTGR